MLADSAERVDAQTPMLLTRRGQRVDSERRPVARFRVRLEHGRKRHVVNTLCLGTRKLGLVVARTPERTRGIIRECVAGTKMQTRTKLGRKRGVGRDDQLCSGRVRSLGDTSRKPAPLVACEVFFAKHDCRTSGIHDRAQLGVETLACTFGDAPIRQHDNPGKRGAGQAGPPMSADESRDEKSPIPVKLVDAWPCQRRGILPESAARRPASTARTIAAAICAGL